MFWLSYESFYILCDVFFIKKQAFPAKTTVSWGHGIATVQLKKKWNFQAC